MARRSQRGEIDRSGWREEWQTDIKKMVRDSHWPRLRVRAGQGQDNESGTVDRDVKGGH